MPAKGRAGTSSSAASSGGFRRGAIYTRKSSEEGLEQSFNSLDAQREACEAYTRSVAQTWKLRFVRSIASICTSVIFYSFPRHYGAEQHHTMPAKGGIHRIRSHSP